MTWLYMTIRPPLIESTATKLKTSKKGNAIPLLLKTFA
jgi:hypothetical protein